MKILIITPPVQAERPGAAEKDMFGAIDMLKQMGHEVMYIALRAPHQAPGVLKGIEKEYGIRTESFLEESSIWQWLGSLVRDLALVDRASYGFHLLAKDSVFNSTVESFKPDAVMAWCSYSWPVFNYFRDRGIRVIFRGHNFEPTFYLEHLSWIEKFSPAVWLRMVGKYLGEKRAVMRSDIIGSIPFDQVKLFEKWKGEKIHILPLVFLSSLLEPSNIHYGKDVLDVFYLGANYRVQFHLRGAELLIEEIVPLVRKMAPGRFRFHLCGAKLPRYLRNQCAGVDLVYEDYVPDLDKFLDEMDIGAFPVFTGKSMKGKVFESICRSFPVVITTLCLGGYDMQDDKEVLIADSVSEFAASLIKLSEDEERERIAAGAYEFARENFDTKKIESTLATLLGENK